MLQINLLTVVPEYFDSLLKTSILGRAIKQNLIEVNLFCLRDFADGKPQGKKQVDDKPFGGGPGMLLKIEPIDRALTFLEDKGQKGQAYLTSASGPIFNQHLAQAWSQLDYLTFICGHYEGVDARVKNLIDGEISLGQFVLTGGEPAAAVMIDAISRLVPGVVGNADSLTEESHSQGELGVGEYPQFTQPRTYRDWSVPEILLSGDHRKIAQWRAEQQVRVEADDQSK